jgi:hypothetical protein
MANRWYVVRNGDGWSIMDGGKLIATAVSPELAEEIARDHDLAQPVRADIRKMATLASMAQSIMTDAATLQGALVRFGREDACPSCGHDHDGLCMTTADTDGNHPGAVCGCVRLGQATVLHTVEVEEVGELRWQAACRTCSWRQDQPSTNPAEAVITGTGHRGVMA